MTNVTAYNPLDDFKSLLAQSKDAKDDKACIDILKKLENIHRKIIQDKNIHFKLREDSGARVRAFEYLEQFFSHDRYYNEELFLTINTILAGLDNIPIKKTDTQKIEFKILFNIKNILALHFDETFKKMIPFYSFKNRDSKNDTIFVNIKVDSTLICEHRYYIINKSNQLFKNNVYKKIIKNNQQLTNKLDSTLAHLFEIEATLKVIFDLIHKKVDKYSASNDTKVKNFLPIFSVLFEIDSIYSPYIAALDDIINQVKDIHKNNKNNKNKCKNQSKNKRNKKNKTIYYDKKNSHQAPESLDTNECISSKVEEIKQVTQEIDNLTINNQAIKNNKPSKIDSNNHTSKEILHHNYASFSNKKSKKPNNELLHCYELNNKNTNHVFNRQRNDLITRIENNEEVTYKELTSFVESRFINGKVIANHGSKRKIQFSDEIIYFHQNHGRDKSSYVRKETLKSVYKCLVNLGIKEINETEGKNKTTNKNKKKQTI